MSTDTLKSTVKFFAISKVDDVSDMAFVNEDYHFPPYALVTYDNSSERLVNVKWNSNTLDTSKEGSFSYTGTMNGYSGKINLFFTAPALGKMLLSQYSTPMVKRYTV